MREIYVKRDEDNNLELWVDGKCVAVVDEHAALCLAGAIVQIHAENTDYF